MGGDKFDKVKEAILIMDAFDELKSKYIGKQGVDIDIEKDIVFHDRIVEHHDATRIGCQPVKVRFRKQTFCNRVKKAANNAGALNGRISIRWGKYKLPRDRDAKGNAITEDPMVLDMHKNRPTNLFFRASITKEKRVELAAQKKIRDDLKKSDGYARSLEKRKEMYETRVSYCKTRNFVSCEVDVRATKEKKEKEEREREKEEERKKALAAVPTP